MPLTMSRRDVLGQMSAAGALAAVSGGWTHGVGSGGGGGTTGQMMVANLQTDFGADPAASDNSAAVQNAFNTCFGNFSSPPGTGAGNIPLFCPSGNYTITQPVYLTGVGPWMFSDGICEFSFYWDHIHTENVTGENSATMFVADGLQYAVFDQITFTRPTFDPNTTGTIGFYLTQTGTRGVSGNNTFNQPTISLFDYGFKIKAAHGCAGNRFNMASFTRNQFSGLYIDCAESINNMVIGGGSSLNTVSGSVRPEVNSVGNSCAAYSVVNGGISLMTNLSNDQIQGIDASHITGTAAASTGEVIIITTAGTYPWRDGDYMRVAQINGTTEANGVFPITVSTLPDGHFQLNGTTWAHAFTSSPNATMWAAYNWDFFCSGSMMNVNGGRGEGFCCACMFNDASTMLFNAYQIGPTNADGLAVVDAQNGGLAIMKNLWFGMAGSLPATGYVGRLGSKGRLIVESQQMPCVNTNVHYYISGSAGSSLYLRGGIIPTKDIYNGIYPTPTTFFGSLNENIPGIVYTAC